MNRPGKLRFSFGALLVILLSSAQTVWSQTALRPGFNLFSTDQDVEIGRQSAAQVERQLPMVRDAAANQYISRLGARLAARAPGAKYPYQFKIANLSDVNAFALPGGFIYINRGLIEQVRSEGQLAGVMAHEISHVALRHPTNQASKAYLAQAGVGILGGLLGDRSRTLTGQVVGAVGGFGMNALFLRFSRKAEEQADVAGAQIMARAGYDPMDMVSFFEMLRQQSGRNPGKFSQFLSDHPAPANRAARVRREAALIGTVRPATPIGNRLAVQSSLRRLPSAPTTAQVASAGSTSSTPPVADEGGIVVEPASTTYRNFRGPRGSFEIQLPDNWSSHSAQNGYGATFAPRGGIVDAAGRRLLVSGVVVNHYVPFDGVVGAGYHDPRGSLYGSGELEEATSDLVHQLESSNPHLERVGPASRGSLSGQPSLTVELDGRSPNTGLDERVVVVTRELSDRHVVYMLLVAPDRDFDQMEPAFRRMIRSLWVNERIAHST